MRIVAVEEHFTFPDLLGRIDLATLDRNGWPAPGTATFNAINPPALADTGRERIAAMDAAGIRMPLGVAEALAEHMALSRLAPTGKTAPGSEVNRWNRIA